MDDCFVARFSLGYVLFFRLFFALGEERLDGCNRIVYGDELLLEVVVDGLDGFFVGLAVTGQRLQRTDLVSDGGRGMAGVFSQLMRSSAFRPPPNNTGAESSTAAATAAERPLLEGTTMDGTGTTGKWTPIFPHNAIQAHGQ